MAVPVLAALVGLAALGKMINSVAGVYGTYKQTENSDRVYDYSLNYAKGYYSENDRYWQQYISRHHLQNREILYPFRTGYHYNLSNLYSAQAGLDNNQLSRNLSWFKLLGTGTSIGPSIYRSM